MHHVNRVEASRQTVYPAFLAADQCVHDLHAGELGQCHEPYPLDYRISYRSADWTPRCTFDFHPRGETLRESIRQCADRWRPDNVGRRLLSHESLPYPLCRAHRDGRNFRSLDPGGLISLRRSRATPSDGMGSGFRTAYPLTFRTYRAKRKGASTAIHPPAITTRTLPTEKRPFHIAESVVDSLDATPDEGPTPRTIDWRQPVPASASAPPNCPYNLARQGSRTPRPKSTQQENPSVHRHQLLYKT